MADKGRVAGPGGGSERSRGKGKSLPFRRTRYNGMVAHGTNKILARFFTYLIRFAPPLEIQTTRSE